MLYYIDKHLSACLQSFSRHIHESMGVFDQLRLQIDHVTLLVNFLCFQLTFSSLTSWI